MTLHRTQGRKATNGFQLALVLVTAAQTLPSCTAFRPGPIEQPVDVPSDIVATMDALGDAGDASDVPGVDAVDSGSVVDALDAGDAQQNENDVQDVANIDVQDVPNLDAQVMGQIRPVAPWSFSDVTQLRPLFRWSLPAGATGAEVQLCRDRACTMVIETIRANGSSAMPMNDLAQRSVVYWRVRATVAGVSVGSYSATWLFHVPTRNAMAVPVANTSSIPHFDYDGDGLDDVAIGARAGSARMGLGVGAPGGGVVRIYHGVRAAGTLQAPVQELGGLSASEVAGDPLMPVGDVNGDGFGDLLVSARNATANGMTGAGLARLYLGSATGVSVGAVNGLPHQTFEGTAMDQTFAVYTAALGDANGDGYADFAIASNVNTDAGRGKIAIYYGSATGASMADPQLLSGVAGEQFGSYLSGAGDVNGDGYAELLVGMRQFTGAGVHSGRIGLYLGGAGGISAMPARIFEGAQANDELGASVGSAGDINGDGYGDFMAAGSNEVSRGGAGFARVYLGAPMIANIAMQWEIVGTTLSDSLGYKCGGIGDFDGDGFGDVAVTSPRGSRAGAEVGIVRVLFGTSIGVGNVRDYTFTGSANEFFGTEFSRTTDFNGDGYSDLFIAAINASAQRGRVYYFVGTLGVQPLMMNRQTLDGVANGEAFGSWVASLDLMGRQQAQRPPTHPTHSDTSHRAAQWWRGVRAL